MNIMTVIRQMLILLLVMATGFGASKTGYLTQDGEKSLSKLIVNITTPATVLYSAFTSSRLDQATLIAALLSAFGFFLIMPFVFKGLIRVLRIPGKLRGDFEAMLLYGNIGFMGIPVISSVLGPDSVLFITIFIAVFNISVFSYGMLLLGGGGFSVKRAVNPGSVSSVLSIVLYLLGVKLPDLPLQALEMVSSVTTPLALIVIGSSLANQSPREALRDRMLLPLTLARLLILPAFILLMCRPVIQDPILLGVLVLTSGMPVASTVVMLKNETGQDTGFVSRCIFVTTLLSVATIPVLSLMLQYFGR